MQSGENSHSLLNGRFQRMDVPSTSRGKSPCFDRRQPPERRQTADIGSIEKLLASGPMQTPEKINILGMKTAKDMKVLGVNRAYDKPSTSGMMQHPETKSNPEIILVSEVISGYNQKNIGVFDSNQQQPKELHAEILLDRPGPSGVRTVPEFQQRMDVMGPPTAMSAADSVISPGGAIAQGEKTQRNRREVIREILSQLSTYTHGIPYPITKYYLESAGFNNFAPEMVQLVGLTAQKYIYDILCDAMVNSKERMARESAERGGTSAGAPLTLTYDDLAPALKKYKENKNLNYTEKKDSTLASFRKLLSERNTSYNDDENDIAITKLENRLENIHQCSHGGNNKIYHLNNEADESGEESMSESTTDDESLTDTSTCSTTDPTSISTSNATNTSSLSLSSSTDDDFDDEDVKVDEDFKDDYVDNDEDVDVLNDEDINNDVDDDDEDEIDDDEIDDEEDDKDDEDEIDDDVKDDKDDEDEIDDVKDEDVKDDESIKDDEDEKDDDDDVDKDEIDDDDDVDDEDDDDDDDDVVTSIQPSRERREVRNIDQLDRAKRRGQDLINMLRNASKSKNSEGEEDECDQFGVLLAEKLKKLDIQHREEIMSEIDNLLLMRVK